jgi:Xaa-Pro aminopeptidase
MKDDGVDVLLVFHPPHVFYLSGFQTFSPYNSECAILPANGSLLLIVDPMEIGGALIHIRGSSVSKGTTRHSAGFPKAKLVDGSTIVPKVKATKSSEEVAHLRRSASITNVGVEAAIDAIEAGKTDNDVAAAAYDLVRHPGVSTTSLHPLDRGPQGTRPRPCAGPAGGGLTPNTRVHRR